MNPVEGHYDRNAEREWDRLERHRTEFAVTCRVLAEFLSPPPGRILDIGGGPGRYALHLTQQGYEVLLLDISRRSLDLAIEKSVAAGVYLPPPLQGDALRLPDRAAEATEDFTGVFDAVLLMGPLYHLMNFEDRLAAVRRGLADIAPGRFHFCGLSDAFCTVARCGDSFAWLDSGASAALPSTACHRPEPGSRGQHLPRLLLRSSGRDRAANESRRLFNGSPSGLRGLAGRPRGSSELHRWRVVGRLGRSQLPSGTRPHTAGRVRSSAIRRSQTRTTL